MYGCHIPLGKIVSTSKDEVKAITDIKKRVCYYFEGKKLVTRVFVNHYTSHQKALCVQAFPEDVYNVMKLVIATTSSILAKDLNFCQLKFF